MWWRKIHSIPILPRVLILRSLKSVWKKTVGKKKKLVPDFQRWAILFLRKKPCSHVKLRLFPGYRILVSGHVKSLAFWLITWRCFLFHSVLETQFSVSCFSESHPCLRKRSLLPSARRPRRSKLSCALYIRRKHILRISQWPVAALAGQSSVSNIGGHVVLGFLISFSAKPRKTWFRWSHYWKQLTCNMSSNIAAHCREPANICSLA